MNVLLFVFIGLSWCGFQDVASQDNSNWMRDRLGRDQKSLPFSRLAIPGSHNSFTSHLDRNSQMADQQTYGWLNIANSITNSLDQIPGGQVVNQVVNRVFSFFGGGGGGGGGSSSNSNNNNRNSNTRVNPNDLAYSWSKTQDLNVTEQFKLGIRYFDARIGYNGYFRIVHGLYGLPLSVEFGELARLARSHRSELIVLYLREFTNFDDVSHRNLADFLRNTFGDTLIKYQTSLGGSPRGLESLTLANMNSYGNVLIIYDEKPRSGEYRTFWPSGSTIVSVWTGISDPDDIMTALGYAVQRYLEPEDDRFSFFLELQGVATPSSQDISTRALSRGANLKDSMAVATTTAFTTWLEGEKGTVPRGAINLCLADFVTSNYVEAVIQLNL